MTPIPTSPRGKRIYRRMLEAFKRHALEFGGDLEDEDGYPLPADSPEVQNSESHRLRCDYLDAVMMFEAWVGTWRDKDEEEEESEGSAESVESHKVDGHTLAAYSLFVGISMGREDRLIEMFGDLKPLPEGAAEDGDQEDDLEWVPF